MNLNKTPMPADQHVLTALRAYTALNEMLRGRAGRTEWNDCADAINVVEALVHAGKLEAQVYAPLINRAIDGLVEAIDCPPAPMRMSRPCENALAAVVAAYDDSMQRLARETVAAARNRVILKIAEQVTNPDNGVRVVG